jgi:two-component system cell cycle sensor histidine kinase PleC
VQVEDGLPMLLADPTKLRQILINLLSNAVKFTPPGGTVAVKAHRDAKGGLLLQVADTGIGIPADKMEVALAPFGQVDGRLARKYEGAGLGLPITKRLAELHDGVMTIESKPGRGTTVCVRFPSERLLSYRAA